MVLGGRMSPVARSGTPSRERGDSCMRPSDGAAAESAAGGAQRLLQGMENEPRVGAVRAIRQGPVSPCASRRSGTLGPRKGMKRNVVPDMRISSDRRAA
jgi:hypothetical protein